ncbi:MAG: hypothetical protein QGD93_10265 [Actinomycetota bacterium]|nr:hypothetical protein [Actinomycetota bacterium]
MTSTIFPTIICVAVILGWIVLLIAFILRGMALRNICEENDRKNDMIIQMGNRNRYLEAFEAKQGDKG